MCVYLCAKFKASSVILTSFRQEREIILHPHPVPTPSQSQPVNSPFRLRLSDCNYTRTHNLLVRKWTLNHLAKLVNGLSCVVRTYLNIVFDCMFLSCQVPVSKWIYILYSYLKVKKLLAQNRRQIWSFRLQTKWFWVRLKMWSLKLQILRLFRTRSSLTFW